MSNNKKVISIKKIFNTLNATSMIKHKNKINISKYYK